MLKFKYKNKGFISQGFGGNAELYAQLNVSGHTGVDYVKGYGNVHQVDNTAYVYKVWKPKERKDRWVGVHMLVPNGKEYMEIIMGHFKSVFVEEGSTIYEGQYVGAEGNSGFVVSHGQEITPAMQDAGDTRGAHVHESWRPVLRVKTLSKDKNYLLKRDNKPFKDAEGYYYEIKYTNAIKGYIDPMAYKWEDSFEDKVRSIIQALTSLKK